MTTAAAPPPVASGSRRPPQQAILLAIVALELIAFTLFGTNFFTPANAMAVLKLNVELALVAVAMTPVIVSGGIDLSVGSVVGLAAVCFGKLAKDAGVPWPVAAAAGVGVGVAGGWVNGLFVARYRIPPLIVTLATLSLFRGVAEGVTAGSANYTDFARGFLAIGQGTLGSLPVQAVALVVAAAFFYLLLHRSTVGRAVSAIGYAPEGARYAGIPVERRVRLAYLMSGTVAAVAAMIYVARVGQARADAGTGLELSAVTAVVLGGTSIFGGRGTVVGTLLGVLALALLDDGLRLADGPPELAGILRGVLLLVAIGADRLPGRRAAVVTELPVEEFEMRNGQLAVLCGTILLAALLVVGGNFALVRTLDRQAGRVRVGGAVAEEHARPADKPKTIAMMPKSKGDAYFVSCRKGAEEAAKELNVNLLWDGPTDSDPAKQNEIVDTWVTRGVDAIAVSVVNGDGLSTALRAARAKGIKVVTWDADAQKDARDLFVNQATPQGIGDALMDNAAKAMNGHGSFAIITASLTDANQNEWMKWIEKRRADKYPDIKLTTVRPSDGLGPKAAEQTRTVLNANPEVTLIMAIAAPAVPYAAEAVKQAGRTDVHVVGLGLPNDNKPYVHSGITTGVVLWNTTDLGYLTVAAADALCRGTLKPGDASFEAGRMHEIKLQGDNVMLGVPFTFTKENIDGFDF